MRHNLSRVFAAGVALLVLTPAFAADMTEPPMIEPAPPVVYEEPDMGGWYIRGDLDYHLAGFRGADYITYGPPAGTNSFTTGALSNSWSIGGGVGYQATKHFRVDATLDYMLRSTFTGSTTGTCAGLPCTSSDTSTYSALLLLANAYADLGTYKGVTPYVGVGIGGAHVNWGTLANTISGVTTNHNGASGWRFAYAAMAGASVCLTGNLDLDVGYRFSHISGGRMFALDAGGGAGPGFDKGIQNHEVRAGLRYKLNGKKSGGCREVAYAPDPAPGPIYKN
ncbi:MAG: porin family protein [Phyllobacteriaceae bacterium]|nr:porin family protein [Phyllobacteriaceae bacterium]